MPLSPLRSLRASLQAVVLGILLVNQLQPVAAQQQRPTDYPNAGVAVQGGTLAAVDSATVARVQQRLLDLGYDPGPADGAMGRRTQGAITSYQRDSGLYPSGEIDGSLLQSLFAERPSRRQQTAPRTSDWRRAETNERLDKPQPVSTELRDLRERVQRLANRAERRQAAAPWVIRRLRELSSDEPSVRGDAGRQPKRVPSSWRRIVFDNFDDGDFVRAPTWSVAFGEFWVDRRLGLRSDSTGRRSSNQRSNIDGSDIGRLVLGAILGNAQRNSQTGGSPERAEIFLPSTIANAFQVRIVLGIDNANGPLALGVYQGDARDQGYYVLMQPDVSSEIKLVRSSRSGTRIVGEARGQFGLADRRQHEIVWTRDLDGRMTVAFDGREVLASADVGFKQAFDGVVLAAQSMDYRVREIEVRELQ